MNEKFFTTEQVANILQVHPFTILKFIKQGKLKGIKLGRVYRIKESDIKNFLEQQTHNVEQTRSAPAEGGPKQNEAPNQKTKPSEKEKQYDLNKNKKDDDNHYYII